MLMLAPRPASKSRICAPARIKTHVPILSESTGGMPVPIRANRILPSISSPFVFGEPVTTSQGQLNCAAKFVLTSTGVQLHGSITGSSEQSRLGSTAIKPQDPPTSDILIGRKEVLR